MMMAEGDRDGDNEVYTRCVHLGLYMLDAWGVRE